MSKRASGITNIQKSHSKKTPKRLEAKRRMLEIKAMKPAERKKTLEEAYDKRMRENKAS
jgi:hypothetical protein